jgi:hypothetical protein
MVVTGGAQTIEFAAGTASAPSITTTGDTNTGIFFPAADTIAFTEGGAEAMRIDSSGRLLVGTTTARVNFFNTSASAGIQIEGTGANRRVAVISDESGQPANLILALQNSGAVGGNTLVSNNDFVGTVSFQGNDGTEFVDLARVDAYVDGTPGANDMPGRLVFSTTANGGSSPTERMRIDSNGNVGIGTTTPIFLSTTGSASARALGIRNSGTSSATRGEIQIGSAATADGEFVGGVVFGSGASTTTSNVTAAIYSVCEGSNITTAQGRLAFYTTSSGGAGAERARITSGGYFKANNSGSYADSGAAYHELGTNADNLILRAQNTNASPSGFAIAYDNAAPNGTGNLFLSCGDTSATRMTVRSNGGIANYTANDVNLSDERVKKDIADLGSQWSCIKDWNLVEFRYKEQEENTPKNYGVIAQQIQEHCPEVVTVFQEAAEAVEAKEAVLDEEGNVIEPAVEAKPAVEERIGVREQQMLWMAVKALQEAMERIETLEANNAALEARITAIENGA